jgi:proteic killer suppression protein
MNIIFASDSLGLVETEDAGETRLPASVINSARRKLTVLRAASDAQSLQNWKSLRHEVLRGQREGQRSIRLNEQYRMVFQINEQHEPLSTTIIAIEDCR